MARSFSRSASFELDLPLAEARGLFTAEGERLWAEGWDPLFPDPERREGAGATFVTAHGPQQTVWVMTDAEPDRVRYARIVANVDAGTVEVRLAEAGPGRTTVTVTYDLTALGAEGAAAIEDFAASYDETIAHWGHAIDRALAAR